MKVEGAWTNVGTEFKPSQRLLGKVVNCWEGNFPAPKYVKFTSMQQGQILTNWLLDRGCW